MDRAEYDYFIYLREKIDDFVIKAAISQVHDGKGRKSKLSAEISGSDNDEEFWVNVFTDDRSSTIQTTVNIKEYLK